MILGEISRLCARFIRLTADKTFAKKGVSERRWALRERRSVNSGGRVLAWSEGQKARTLSVLEAPQTGRSAGIRRCGATGNLLPRHLREDVLRRYRGSASRSAVPAAELRIRPNFRRNSHRRYLPVRSGCVRPVAQPQPVRQLPRGRNASVVLHRRGARLRPTLTAPGRHLTDAVFAYYIVHKTAIILIAHHIRSMGLSALVEAGIVIGGTLASCAATYEVVRRVRLLRPLFGLAIATFCGDSAPSGRDPER
jgi:hypothetical protein